MTNPYSLGDFDLKLRSTLPPPAALQRPNWKLLQQSQLQQLIRSNSTRRLGSRPSAAAHRPVRKAPLQSPFYKSGGPTAPDTAPLRMGEVSDVFDAVWKLPQVQASVQRLLPEAERHLRKKLSSLSGGDTTVLTIGLGLIAGGALAGVISHSETRAEALKLASGSKIDVPGVEGLAIEFKYKDGEGQRQPELGGALYFDVMPYLHKLGL